MLAKKYGNRFCTYKGIKFHSQLERELYLWLKILINRSSIANLIEVVLQRKISLINNKPHGRISYVADYYVYHKDNGINDMNLALILDAKGIVTTLFSHKRILAKSIHDIDIICVNSKFKLTKAFQKWVSKYEV